MTEAEHRAESLRRAADYRLGEPRVAEPASAEASGTEGSAASSPSRAAVDQGLWVDQQIRAAIARGEFDNLPYQGQPLPRRLTDPGDRDWWLKQLIEREKVTGVLPPALGLRVEDAEFDATLDQTGSEDRARELIDDFNRRIIEARRQLQGGPPVITPLRDVDETIQAWQQRRSARAARRTAEQPLIDVRPRRRWWRRHR